jgi:TetR/AcrR family transcriptional regulator, transcriptional repressor for nem operon
LARPRTFDEDQVLEGAVELFRQKGFEGTSVPELVERLGICRQSLYTAFGDKHGLYLKVLERYGQREIDTKLELLAGAGSPLNHVRTIVRGWADLATRCPGEGCLTAKAIAEYSDDPQVLSLAEAQVVRLEEGFRDALERAQAAGELRPEADPAQLARVLVTAVYGIGILSRLPGGGPRIADSVSVLLGLLDDGAA